MNSFRNELDAPSGASKDNRLLQRNNLRAQLVPERVRTGRPNSFRNKFLLLCLLLLGCAPQPGPKVTTIRFWAMGHEGEVVRSLADQFERENPGIRIDVQQIPWSAAHEKLLTAHVGRSSPDAAQLGNTWIAEFHALDALEPLSARAAASKDVPKSAFFEGIWNTNVVDGETWGIPWYVDTRVLFYRKDLLHAAGYDSVPQDWAGWRAAMAAVVKHTGQKAILLPVNEWTVPVVLGLQAGSPLLKDNGTRGAFADPQFKEAFDFYQGLFKDGLAPGLANTEISNLYQEFARGSFAMYVTGPWNLSEFAARMPDSLKDAWDTAPIPGPNGPGVSTAGGSSLVVFRSSRHQEEAWRWVEFLSRPESQRKFFHDSGDLPARREAWDDSTLASNPRAQAFREQFERVAPTPLVPEWELIATRLQVKVEAAIRGAIPGDSALAQLDREVDKILAKRRWMLGRKVAAK